MNNNFNYPSELELATCLLRERFYLKSQLHNKFKLIKSNEQELIKLWQIIRHSQEIFANRQAQIPAQIDYPIELPISERRADIVDLIINNQVIIICGETGSGKSTQLPKICLDLKRGCAGRIGHTQPRRIAARSLAQRIAQELGSSGAGLVGYQVRFHDHVRPETCIKLMTDGILLAEIQQDRLLYQYDTLIIDEAHERSLNIDFLLGYLKGILPRRPELKLIITSATIDPQRFAEHFKNSRGQPAPILEISGRTYPVTIIYRPPEVEYASECDEVLQNAIIQAVMEAARIGPGDILIFLSGEREIRTTAESLRKHHPPGSEILPLFARQGPNEQARIFQNHSNRRIILATNVAETSLTVPGIQFVIDPGFARISRYSHRTKVLRLPVERISQASAQQRAGRCGRIAAGVCIRLYTQENFISRTLFTSPEIARANLATVILQMKILGFGALEKFPFIDPPDYRLISDGYRTLQELAALDEKKVLTPLGRKLAQLPVDPRLGRILLAATELNCLTEILIIAAALSVQDPRERPLNQTQAADQIHQTFNHPDSDFLSLLNLWNFLIKERAQLSRNKFMQLCQRHFLAWNRVQEWRDTHTQLREQLLTMGLRENQSAGSFEEIHRALISGFLSNIGLREGKLEFQGVRNSRFFIHPSSALFKQPPKWIFVAERVETSRHYGRTVAKIQPEWIEDAGQHLVTRKYSDPHWQAQSGQVAAFEQVSLFGVILIYQRRVNYGPLNPVEAREIFLRHGLVAGDFQTRAPFWRHNQELIEQVKILEAKARRRDLLIDEEELYVFYHNRVPAGIYSTPQFEQWLRQISHTEPKILHLRFNDLLKNSTEHITENNFPDYLSIGINPLPLKYHFEPGTPHDGITLVVPLPLLPQISAARLDWLVPGLLAERITALLRGLPKNFRKLLVPIPEFAARLAARVKPNESSLIQVLSQEIHKLSGVAIPEQAWDLASLPEHLRMKIGLIDPAGQHIALGTDPVSLRHEFGVQANLGLNERTGIKCWDCGDLPEKIEREHAGIRLNGYPALVDAGTCVSLRIFDSLKAAELAHLTGLRRLYFLQLGDRARLLRAQIPNLIKLRLQYSKIPILEINNFKKNNKNQVIKLDWDIADEILAGAIDQVLLNSPLPRTQTEFSQRLTKRAAQLTPMMRTVSQQFNNILTLYQTLSLNLEKFKQINWQPTILDIREQLNFLVFQGFTRVIPWQQLAHYPRYLQAIEIRLERLNHAPQRDQQWLTELAPLQTRWREQFIAAQAAERDPAREWEIHWLLQELRVSFFAQQLGTAVPISIKRIETRWRELGI